MIEYCHALGHETCCNIMAISQVDTEQIRMALEMLNETCVDVI